VGRKGVVLLWRSPRQRFEQDGKDAELLGSEDAAGRRGVLGGAARGDELHGRGGGDESHGGELFESLAVLDDALLEAQSLLLEGSKELFDIPAPAIPADDGDGLFDAVDGMGGQELPQDGLLPWRRVDLAGLDGEQLDLGRGLAIGA